MLSLLLLIFGFYYFNREIRLRDLPQRKWLFLLTLAVMGPVLFFHLIELLFFPEQTVGSQAGLIKDMIIVLGAPLVSLVLMIVTYKKMPRHNPADKEVQ